MSVPDFIWAAISAPKGVMPEEAERLIEEGNHWVYELWDARINAPFYVGCTNDPPTRLYKHCSSLSVRSPVASYIRTLRFNRQYPRMRLVSCHSDRAEALHIEAGQIRYRASWGYGLANIDSAIADPINCPPGLELFPLEVYEKVEMYMPRDEDLPLPAELLKFTRALSPPGKRQ